MPNHLESLIKRHKLSPFIRIINILEIQPLNQTLTKPAWLTHVHLMLAVNPDINQSQIRTIRQSQLQTGVKLTVQPATSSIAQLLSLGMGLDLIHANRQNPRFLQDKTCMKTPMLAMTKQRITQINHSLLQFRIQHISPRTITY
jgi:hypothetical protein